MELRSQRRIWAAAGLAVLLLGVAVRASAGELHLKNGFVIEGNVAFIKELRSTGVQLANASNKHLPIAIVDDGVRRYFVSNRRIADVQFAEDLGRYETFELKHKRTGQHTMVQSLGGFVDITPFDEDGRRQVKVRSGDRDRTIFQGITQITPKVVSVVGTSHKWEHGLATNTIPVKDLDAILRKATDPSSTDDRMKIARFYLQAGFYGESSDELESIARDFPTLQPGVEKVREELRQLEAEQLLTELRQRRAAGQHQLAYNYAVSFPTEGMSAEVLRQVRELRADYEKALEQADLAKYLLGELQSQLEPAQAERIAPLRALLCDELSYEGLPRLDAFLKLAEDPGLSPAEKLGLAYSGWVLGSENAATDLEAAIRLWNVRFLSADYLRSSDETRRAEVLAKVVESEGITAQKLLQLAPHLPLPRENTEIAPGTAYRIVVNQDSRAENEREVAYSVLLPPEYHPDHQYPLIVTLRPAERTAADMLEWWGLSRSEKGVTQGQSQRHGYIVIAPEYIAEGEQQYDYGTAAHKIVLDSIDDARKRFQVDSNRVFLSGHGIGGDAAFDIALSHPDLFAGVVPITGTIDKIASRYRDNGLHLAWYIVSGQIDRDTLARNEKMIDGMLKHGFDLVYVEHPGRGYESYYSEIQRIFEWMNLQQRVTAVKDIEAAVLRPSDDRFYWLQARDLPESMTRPTDTGDATSGSGRAMELKATVTASNNIMITHSGAPRHTVWISPGMVDFKEIVQVQRRSKNAFRGMLEPSVETILEDLRVRGDRQNIYTVRIDVD